MGRKKKRPAKPWCWYCNREFDDDKILIQHQKAKHFKCHICNKKLFTGPGLAIHCMQVHKETIDKIPGAIPGRDSVDVEVYGMDGIPQEYDGGEPSSKKQMPMQASLMPQMPPPMGGMMPPPVSGPGMPYPMGPGLVPNYSNPYYPMMPQAMPPMPVSVPQMPQIAIRMPTSLPGAGQIPLPTSAPPTMFPNYHNPEPARIPEPVQEPTPSKPVGPKTRIIVPDENLSLEEHMANRLNLLSQSRFR